MDARFGFIHGKLEIKILILFILARVPAPVGFDTLTELSLCDDGISYFDYSECVAELIKTGHLDFSDNKYSLTEKGTRNGSATERNIPYSVRMAAEKNVAAASAMLLRDGMLKASHTLRGDGSCNVTLSLSDTLGEVVSISTYAATEQQAEMIERGFRKRAEGVYTKLMKFILDE